jgi:hypothetical protein
VTKSRLEAFSDGVFAIIITIMVLELRAPHEMNFGALRPLTAVFLSYVLSFVWTDFAIQCKPQQPGELHSSAMTPSLRQRQRFLECGGQAQRHTAFLCSASRLKGSSIKPAG